MSAFSFDTSGYLHGVMVNGARQTIRWSDLSPGVQGCIAGMLEELNKRRRRITRTGYRPYGFSDLHPDTLARIIADWERFVTGLAGGHDGLFESGRAFWVSRQKGFGVGAQQALYAAAFPPQTPYVSDEGKVCLREARP